MTRSNMNSHLTQAVSSTTMWIIIMKNIMMDMVTISKCRMEITVLIFMVIRIVKRRFLNLQWAIVKALMMVSVTGIKFNLFNLTWILIFVYSSFWYFCFVEEQVYPQHQAHNNVTIVNCPNTPPQHTNPNPVVFQNSPANCHHPLSPLLQHSRQFLV